MDNQVLWQTVLADLALQVSKPVFQTILSQTTLLSFENDTATIGCRLPMMINLLEKRYYQLIKKTLDEYTKTDVKLVFTASPQKEKNRLDMPLFTVKVKPKTASLTYNIRLNPTYTFDNFAVSSSNQMAYAAATAVAKSPGTSYNPLFLYGGVGVGKTHLMQAIGHHVLRQDSFIKTIYCTGE